MAGTEPNEPVRHRLQERALFAAFVLLLWVTRFTPPQHPAVPELDPSWAQALGYALVHGLQFGKDLVFTYGPLGWFVHSAWQPELFWWKLLGFELAFKFTLCVILASAIFRLSGPVARLAFALVILIPDPGAEAFYFASLVALAAWLLEHVPADPARPHGVRELARAAPIWFLIAVVAWIKFTYLLLAVVVIFAVAARLFMHGARAGAARHVALVTAFLLLLWCSAGQNPLNIPAYVTSSWQVARGYAQAMSAPSTPIDVGLALASLGVGLASLVLAWRKSGPRELLPRAVLFAAGAFVAFKAGFVSSGSTAITCFGFALWAPWFLERAQTSTGVVPAIVRVVVFGLAFAGYQRAQIASSGELSRPFAAWNHLVAERWNSITQLGTLPEAYGLERTALAQEHALPRIRERVGAEGVDVFQVELAVLFLNDLRWRPRPVFQSYAAYTKELAERNARHFASELAPRFVLWRFGTIDNRLPGFDDAPALLEVLRRYRPLLSEGGYLLLEREDGDGRPVRVEEVLRRDIVLDERVELPALPDRGGVLRLELRPTLAGGLNGFLHQWPRVELELETDGGLKGTFRIVPDAARAGVLIDPWMCGQDAIESAGAGGTSQRVVAVRVVSNEAVASAFERLIGLVYEHHQGLIPPYDPERARALRYSMFDRAPATTREVLPFERGVIQGRAVLVVHAPSELVWELEPGRWRVDARFGMVPPGDGNLCTDGAVFALVLRNERGDAAFWRQALDPRSRPADQSMQKTSQEFSLPVGTRFVLRTNVGPKSDGACDWCYWTDVSFTRLGAEDKR